MAIIKKKFFEIEIPALGMKIKAYSQNIEALDKRIIKLDLTRQLRGKSIEASIVVNVKESRATAELTKLSLLQFYIRRAMRSSISYVEDSFSADCKNAVLRIKPFMITRKKVSRQVRKALRNNSRLFLTEYAKDKTAEQIFEEIISSRLQKSLSLKMKKIYPLAFCEIRQIYIESKKEQEAGKKVEKEKIKEEEKVEPIVKEKVKRARKKKEETKESSKKEEKIEEKVE